MPGTKNKCIAEQTRRETGWFFIWNVPKLTQDIRPTPLSTQLHPTHPTPKQPKEHIGSCQMTYFAMRATPNTDTRAMND